MEDRLILVTHNCLYNLIGRIEELVVVIVVLY